MKRSMLRATASAALGVSAACSAGPAVTTQPTDTSQTTTASAIVQAAPPKKHEYIVRVPPATATTSRVNLDDGKLGVLLRGERLVVDALGNPLQFGDEGKRLLSVFPVDKGAGGGFLFVGAEAVYFAQAFRDPLVELYPGSVSSASAGAGFALVVLGDGRVRAVDFKGKKRAGLPAGPLVARAADDGTTALITHGGRAFVSRDAGASFSDITADVGLPVGLTVSEGGLYVEDATGEAVRVDGGSLARTVAPARPSSPAPSKELKPEPRARSRSSAACSSTTIARSSSTAAALDVSLRTGEILSTERGVLPPNANCVPVSATDAILILCSASDTSSVFKRSRRGGTLSLEHAFAFRGLFRHGRGDSLLFEGSCKGGTGPVAGVACVRSRSGDWIELDRSNELSDAAKSDPLRPIVWIPKEEGALLVVSGKGGGIWDARTGGKTKLDVDEMAALESVFSQSALGSGGFVNERLAVVEGGTVVGYGRDNIGFRVSEGGKVIERSPFRFNTVAIAGSHTLASDATGSLWQSLDWGWTYVEVAAPPVAENVREDPRVCSDVGCSLNSWLRLGWEASAPEKRPPAPPGLGHVNPRQPDLPQFKCTATGAIVRKGVGVADDARPGFGAENLTFSEDSYFGTYPRGLPAFGLENSNLRAMVTGKVPALDGLVPTSSSLKSTRKVRFLEPFDPKAAPHEASFKLSELLDAARSTGVQPPDFGMPEERGQSITVLSNPPGALLVAAPNPAVWVHGKEKPFIFGLPEDMAGPVLSAVATGADELAILHTNWDGDELVRLLGKGRVNDLFTVPRLPNPLGQPANPDVLALGTDGKVALVRLVSELPPTDEDPALLVRPNEAPVALAPWSKLDVDGSPACATMTGYHMVLASTTPWVDVGAANNTFSGLPAYYLLRWSETALCLEAAEVPFGSLDLPNGNQGESYIVMRFGKDGGAGHVMVAEGAELREPRTCELLR
ncbi:MAG: hypothetical protein U0271_31595 [Polyangiaceae bacterium]